MIPTTEKVANLADTIAKIVAKRGNGLWEPDALLQAIAGSNDGAMREYWSISHRVSEVVGLVRYLREPNYLFALEHENQRGKRSPLQVELAKRDILVWLGANAFRNDGSFGIRLVNTKWLKKPDDILEHVTKQWDVSTSCRFCTIIERPDPLNACRVVPVDPCDDGPPREGHGPSMHVECEPHWRQWKGLADAWAKSRTDVRKSAARARG